MSAFAVNSTGYAQAQVTLSTSSVWTMKSSDPLVGRINYQIKQLDSALAMATGNFEVLQFDDQVLAVDRSKNQLRPLDITAVTLGSQSTFPRNAEVGLGAGTISIADPATGKWWLGTASSLSGLSPATTPPMLTVAPGMTSVVSVTGRAFAVAQGWNKLWSVAVGSDGLPTGWATDKAGKLVPPAPAVMPGGVLSSAAASLASPISISAVGDVPVVLDSAAKSLIIGQNRVSVTAGAVLQQPGPSSSSVVLSTPTQLLAYPLAGGPPVVLFGNGSGVPVAPVLVDGCARGAWNGAALVEALSCEGAPTSQSVTLPSTGKVDPVFRVNRDVVVLNDRFSGRTWSAGKDLHVDTIDNWDQVKPQNQSNKPGNNPGSNTQSPEVATPRANCAKQGPAKSVANPAKFTVRAGRATILPVLNFVSAGDCAAVRIDAVKGLVVSGAAAVVVQGGQAVQVTTAPGTSETLSMTYAIGDGVSPAASAPLTVSVVPTTQVGAIKKYKQSSIEVEVNGTVSYNVLPDYYSTTGDDLYLSNASSLTPEETVRFTPGGEITFGDKGLSGTGKHYVQFTVTDGTATYQDKLTVNVLAEGAGKLTASAVLASSLVGVPVRSQPLQGVLWPGAAPLQLTGVTAKGASSGASATLSGDGTVLLAATKVGTYYFTYAVAANDAKATGVLRFDVTKPDPAARLVATTDVVYLPEGDSVRVDPTANDIDPNGVGLAVQRVGAQSSSQLNVTDTDMQTLQIAARGSLTAPTAFSYTISNGLELATGQVRVVPVPALNDSPIPVASPISLSVRAGDVLSLPLARFASDPRGQALTPSIVGDPSTVPGVLIANKTTIRYLAPLVAPASPVKFGYAVTNTSGKTSAGATVTLTVVGLDPSTDAAPNPPAPVIVRVLTGKVVTFPLPLDGIDPDGDWVTLTSVSEPSKHLGTAAAIGMSSIAYSASKSGGGVDTISYIVSDPYGKTANGTVTVIVVPAPNQVQPPVAPNLLASVRPGKAVSLRPLDSGVTGENVKFDTPAFDASPGWVINRDGDALVISAPGLASGAGTIGYHVVDDRGQRAGGVISVTVSPTAPLAPPLVQDIIVKKQMVPDGANAMVDVTTAIKNNNGLNADLTLGLRPGTGASLASARVVKVPLAAHRQVVAYSATDGENQMSTAFLVVPAKSDLVDIPPPKQLAQPTPKSDLPPVPKSSVAPLTVHAGQSVSGQIGDYVDVPAGQRAQIVDRQALVANQGTGKRNDATGFTFTANSTGSGPDALTVPVSVGNSSTIDVQIPIQIIPNAPHLTGVPLSVEVNRTGTLDLTVMVDPNYPGKNALSYVITGGATGFQVSHSGSTLTVAVGAVPKGTQVVLTVVASDSGNQSATATVTVTATGTTKPLPTLTPAPPAVGKPGVSTSFAVLAGSSDPFGQGLTIVPGSVTVVQGIATAAISGSSITVMPSAGQVGTVAVQFSVADGSHDASRNVVGKVTLVVKDKPLPPTAPTLVPGSANATSVEINWDWPDSSARGGKLISYTVTANGVDPIDCGTLTTCLINHLNPGTPYRFIVVVTTDVGTSMSSASAPITPDQNPDTPGKPKLRYMGRGSIEVTWTIPTGDFSAVVSERLTGTGSDGSTVVPRLDGLPQSVVVNNLNQDVDYTFTIQVTNHTRVPTASPSSEPLRASGSPITAPASISADFLYPNKASRTIRVSWVPPTDNGGETPTDYLISLDHQPIGTASSSSRSFTIPNGFSDGTHAITVAAENRHGPGPTAAAEVLAFTQPAVVAGVTATASRPDSSIDVNWSAISPPDSLVVSYQQEMSMDGNSAGNPSGPISGTSTTVNTLDNRSSYQFKVNACFSQPTGGSYSPDVLCGPFSDSSSAAVPYGPPKNFGISATPQGDQLVFSWNVSEASNGRPIVSATYSIDTGGSGDAMSGTATSIHSYYTKSTITVTVVDKANQQRIEISTSVAADNPNKQLSISFSGPNGDNGSGYCTVRACRQVLISGSGWRPGSTVTVNYNTDCAASSPGSVAACKGNPPGNQTPYRSVTVSVRSDGTVDPNGRWFGFPGAHVWIDIDGISSNHIEC